MKSSLRIVHASDIHLDTDYHGGSRNIESRDFYRGVFRRLLDRIAAHQPDLMLLPGDLFDSNRASGDTIAWSLEQLGALAFPVLIIPGNHDCLEEDAIFLRHDFERAANVKMLLNPDGECRVLSRLGAVVWGRGMIAHRPDFQPLHHLPAPRPGYWNLAMGHGIYTGSDGNGFRSSPIRSDEIANSGYDYIALGHHHVLLDVSEPGTRALFSGAPVPISPERKGTYVVVTLEKGREPTIEIKHLD